MSAIAIVTQRLLASPKVTEIVGDKIFPIMAPQQESRPYIVLHIIDNDDAPYLYGAARYYRTTVQVDVYSELTPDGAKQVIEVGDSVINALNGVVKQKIAGCVDVDILLGSADFTESALEANTHRRYTQFNVRWRVQPGVPAEEDESPALGEYAFSIVAAANGGNIGYVGADHFASMPPMGALSAEPVSGYPLLECARRAAPSNNSIIAFAGDVSTLFAGKSVWIDGVDYGEGEQYKFTYTGGVTLWNMITGGPEFVAGETYDVEIK